MAPFDELQVLWQSQPQTAVRDFDPVPLGRAFRRLGRRQDIINILKLILIATALVHTIVNQRHRPLMLLALGLILCSGVVAVVAEWRIQRGIARLDFSAPSVAFVGRAIAHMEAQRNPFHTRAYFALFAAMLAAYNLMALASWHKLTPERRISSHLLATAVPVILYAFGRVVRAKRFQTEYRPLIERLTVLRETLEERTR